MTLRIQAAFAAQLVLALRRSRLFALAGAWRPQTRPVLTVVSFSASGSGSDGPSADAQFTTGAGFIDPVDE